MLFKHELVADAVVGETVEFDKVLLVAGDGEVRVGTPYLEGAKVSGTVREIARDDKIVVYKYKSKKGYRRKQGHRQSYVATTITGIEG